MIIYNFPAIINEAEKGGYYATFPDFPECYAQGKTIPELYIKAQESLKKAIESKINDCKYVPVYGILDYTDLIQDISVVWFSVNVML